MFSQAVDHHSPMISSLPPLDGSTSPDDTLASSSPHHADADDSFSTPASPLPPPKLESIAPSTPTPTSPSSDAAPSAVACPVCARLFQNRGRLHIHMRTHTDERPFACPKCPLRFRQKCHLARHLGTHSQRALRPFACRVCDRRFRQASNCRAHEQRHLRAESRVNRSLNAAQRLVIDQIREDYADGQTRPAPVAVVDTRVDATVLAMLDEPALNAPVDAVKTEAIDGFVQAKWQKSAWKKSPRTPPSAQGESRPPVVVPAAFPEPTIVPSRVQAVAEPMTPPAASSRRPAVLPVRRAISLPVAGAVVPELKPVLLKRAEQEPTVMPEWVGGGCVPSWSVSLSCVDAVSEMESACSSPSSVCSDSSFSSSASSSSFTSFSPSTSPEAAPDMPDLSFLALSATDLLEMMAPSEFALGGLGHREAVGSSIVDRWAF